MHVDCVTANERAVDGLARIGLSDVPDLDVEVPTAGHDQVWVFLVELAAENLGGMTRVTRMTALELTNEATSLFIIDPNNTVGAA